MSELKKKGVVFEEYDMGQEWQQVRGDKDESDLYDG